MWAKPKEYAFGILQALGKSKMGVFPSLLPPLFFGLRGKWFFVVFFLDFVLAFEPVLDFNTRAVADEKFSWDTRFPDVREATFLRFRVPILGFSLFRGKVPGLGFSSFFSDRGAGF